jgi:sugar-specific transcriptional regulator TrmB
VPTRDEVVSQLQDIGLSGYEGKAYLALILSERPLNGYEVAKRSGVPRSTVYETLGKLSARGAAFEVHEGDTTTYVALPPDALLRRVRDKVEENLEALATHLDAITGPPAAPLSYHLEGQVAVLERALDLIGAAKREIYVSGWQEQLGDLEAGLLKAERLGVHVTLIRIGDGSSSVGRTVGHRFPDPASVLEQNGCRLLVIVQDRRNVLLAGTVDGQMWALHSDEPALVVLVTEHLRNDIALQALVEHVGIATAESLTSAAEIGQLQRGRLAPGLEHRSRR